MGGAQSGGQLSARRVLVFWAPLAATWLMMAAEGPFVAALIARLAEPKFNLAAFGVAFSFALLVESPIMMMLTAATALVRDRQSFRALRRFIYTLDGLITAFMLVLLLPPVFRFVAERLIGLPDDVAHLAHVATAIFLPWPAAIGYRRFYQGVLIRSGLPRRVAYGTVVRLFSMAITAVALYLLVEPPGAYLGAAALSAGVVMEAVASRVMAAGAVRRLLSEPAAPERQRASLTTRFIASFYYPLALTSLLTLGVNPLITFFMGHSRLPIVSLAVFPVLTSLVFIFRSGGFAFQEVGIALLGDRREGLPALRRFAGLLALATSCGLALLAFTPLAVTWFHRVSGLSPELTRVALWPLRILFLMPALEVLLSLQRALLVHSRRTAQVTWGTAVEVGGIVGGLVAGLVGLDLVGVVAAAGAMLLGRLAANGYLAFKLTRRSGV
jgi:progressive ankylosis protein